MIKIEKILVAKDFSESAEAALHFAIALAVRYGAALHVLYAQVIHGDAFDAPIYPAGHTERIRAKMKEVAAQMVKKHKDADLDRLAVENVIVRDVAAGPAIVRYATEHEIDLIVMGTHGNRGLRHFLIGSVAEEVVRLAPCPVLTVRAREEAVVEVQGSTSILVPVDFSRHALEAVRYAREVADTLGGRVDLLHVIEEALHPAFYNTGAFSIYDIQPNLKEHAVLHLERLFEEAGGPAVEVRFLVRSGQASHEVVAYAEEAESSMILMSTHGLSGLAHFFIGSVAERVVRTAPCPVFTIKSFGRSLLPDRAEEEAAVAE